MRELTDEERRSEELATLARDAAKYEAESAGLRAEAYARDYKPNDEGNYTSKKARRATKLAIKDMRREMLTMPASMAALLGVKPTTRRLK